MADDANLLILDEPTNDLDIPTVHALEEALQEFDGCAIIVSHDRYFLNRVCNTIVAFEDKQLTRYNGDYDDYRAAQDERHALDETSEKDAEPEIDSSDERSAADEIEDPDGPAPLNYREQQELETIEDQILEVEARKESLEDQLSDPDLYAERADEIEELNRELRQVEGELEELYERWTHLSERAQLNR
jgi:ATP-binding cassette subfamily F protein uup